MALSNPKKIFLWLGAAVLAGITAGVVLRPGTHWTYLELQAISDALHRFTLVSLPLLALVAIVSVVVAYIGHHRFRNFLLGLAVFCLALGSGVLSYTLGFDAVLESRGLTGQFEVYTGDSAGTPRSFEARGHFLEESNEHGTIHQALPNGDALNLDDQMIFRVTDTGRIQWRLPRPGRRPGSLLTVADTLFFAGGGEYEDDMVVAAIAIESGRRWWSYHCLGNRVFPPIVDGPDLVFVAWRPASSSVSVIRWNTPSLLWAIRFDTPLVLPARFTERGIEVTDGVELVLLERGNGQVLNRQAACVPKAAPGLVCQAGRVVAWKPQESP